jgi:hypothetical protein
MVDQRTSEDRAEMIVATIAACTPEPAPFAGMPQILWDAIKGHYQGDEYRVGLRDGTILGFEDAVCLPERRASGVVPTRLLLELG